MALAARMNCQQHRVYVMVGCGETQEGQVWEAAMAAAHYKLDNFAVIVDYNGLQVDGPNEEIMEIAPLADKWQAFGWQALEIDGHSMPGILEAFSTARETRDKPTAIIARTVKGKGVSFMEHKVEWHAGPPSKVQLEQALAELTGVGGICG
jgi:transketolase